MGVINPQHFLEELRDNRRTGDTIKARFLIDQFGRLEPEFQARVFCEILSDRSRFGSVLLGYIAARAGRCSISMEELKKAIAARLREDPGLADVFMSGEEFRDKSLFEELSGQVDTK